MFEHFTFAAQAQTIQDEVSAPPTDISFPVSLSPPPASYVPTQLDGVSDIVNQFSKQSLCPETGNQLPQRSIWQGREEGPPTIDIDHDMETFSPDELTYLSTTKGMVAINSMGSQSLPNTPTLPQPRSGTVACRRLQRQLDVQLQSCSNHVRDINALVEDMISSNSQCRLHKSPTRPYLPSPTPSRTSREELVIDVTESSQEAVPFEDEGFAEMDDSTWGIEEEISLRRASAPIGIRKYNNMRFRSSVEPCGPGVGGNGMAKVRNITRMRRRKVKSVPE